MASIRVLLVADDIAFVQRVERALSMVEGLFSVHTVDCVIDALKSLQAMVFNVVLLDLTLPEISGLDALDAIHAGNHKLPIVILTSVDDPGLEAEALKRGAQQFLRKTNLGELIETMRKAVGIRLREPGNVPREVEGLLNDLDGSLAASKQAVSKLDRQRTDPAERDAVLALRSHLGKMQSRISAFRKDGK